MKKQMNLRLDGDLLKEFEALDIKLSNDEIKKLEEPYIPHQIIGHG